MQRHCKSARDRRPLPRERPQPRPQSTDAPASRWNEMFALMLMELRRAARQRRRQEKYR